MHEDATSTRCLNDMGNLHALVLEAKVQELLAKTEEMQQVCREVRSLDRLRPDGSWQNDVASWKKS